MCRNIRTLYNLDPPATEDEIRASAIQFVRKLSGYQKPSRINQVAFDQAIEEVARTSSRLIASLQTSAAPRNREVQAAKAKARAAQRF